MRPNDGVPELDAFDSPEAMLDHLRDQTGWTDAAREAFLGRLVERFPAARVVATLRRRLDDLDGPDAEAVLRLAEAYPMPDLLDDLARAVESQPGLAPERAWEALAILAGTGRLEQRPALSERWEELNELLEADAGDAVAELVEQIEGDPDGPWLALEGLSDIEPELRCEIIAGLEGHEVGPGVITFLHLVIADDAGPARDAALGILRQLDPARPEVVSAWSTLASQHPDGALRREAARRSGRSTLPAIRPGSEDVPARSAPAMVRSLVTAVDGEGLATIVLAARGPAGLTTAAFVCDLEQGIRAVDGALADDEIEAEAAFDDLAARLNREAIEGAHDLALGLVAACLTLTGPHRPEGLDHWLGLTAGPDLAPRPFPASFPGWDPASLPFDEMPRRASAVLDACPDWIDASPLTLEMAREIRLREGRVPPDPGRDAGAYRYLFEHGLKHRLERYRRMLLWMAWFWRSGGDEERGRSALTLACQLADAQHVVPGHPFTVELTTRSLRVALERLGG